MPGGAKRAGERLRQVDARARRAVDAADVFGRLGLDAVDPVQHLAAIAPARALAEHPRLEQRHAEIRPALAQVPRGRDPGQPSADDGHVDAAAAREGRRRARRLALRHPDRAVLVGSLVGHPGNLLMLDVGTPGGGLVTLLGRRVHLCLKDLYAQDVVEMIERETRRYEVEAIEHPDHPDFERAFEVLWDAFGRTGEMESAPGHRGDAPRRPVRPAALGHLRPLLPARRPRPGDRRDPRRARRAHAC